MSWNTFGRILRFTTWGESHGPAIGAVVDGCPPGLTLSEDDIQPFLDARKPGQNKFTTQRNEPDAVRILSGVFEGSHHRHVDRLADREHRPALEGLFRDRQDPTDRAMPIMPMMRNTACATIAAADAAARARPR